MSETETSGKSGGIRRERTLNGELRRQTPLPIHLAIESGDHTPIKKIERRAPWTWSLRGSTLRLDMLDIACVELFEVFLLRI